MAPPGGDFAVNQELQGDSIGDWVATNSTSVASILARRYPGLDETLYEDAVAEATLKILERYRGVENETYRRALYIKLAEWGLLDRLREAKRFADLLPHAASTHSESVEREVAAKEVLEAAYDPRLLTEKSRHAVTMWARGVSFKEIARRLRIRTAHARKKKERALSKLKKALGR